MGVIDVIEETEQQSTDLSAEDAKHTSVFTVKFDEGDLPENRSLIAVSAIGIPPLWSTHKFNQWLFVKNKTTRAKGPLLYEVFVHYTVQGQLDTQSAINPDPFLNPLDQPPIFTYSFVSTNERIDHGFRISNRFDLLLNRGTFEAITNSAGQSYDPPVGRPVSDLVVRVEKNQETYDPVFAAGYMDSVNNAEFWGFKPNMIRIIDFAGQPMRSPHFRYFKVNYAFQIRLQEVNGINYGWILRLLDEGMSTFDGLDSAGYAKWKRIEDNEGPVSEPYPLDGFGNKLSGKRYTERDHEFRLYKTFPEKDFSELGL